MKCDRELSYLGNKEYKQKHVNITKVKENPMK